MAYLKIDFSNCDVKIEKMFDIHDNQNVNVYNNVSKNKTEACKRRGCRISGDATSQQEKQHGVEYPTFSKGSGVTDDHIKALYRHLTARSWISTQTKEADFLRLFNGEDNNCEIIWMGLDKLGNNRPTILGVSALYVLFKTMADEGLITMGGKDKIKRVGPILESHFVDTDGHFLKSVSNVSSTSKKADGYICTILRIMRMRPNSEDIQRLLQEDMKSKYDEYDRQDLNYRRSH